jgi:hypothetical protein
MTRRRSRRAGWPRWRQLEPLQVVVQLLEQQLSASSTLPAASLSIWRQGQEDDQYEGEYHNVLGALGDLWIRLSFERECTSFVPSQASDLAS